MKALNCTDVSDKDFLKLVFSHLINVNFNGASVMPGQFLGVQAHMKEMVLGLLYTYCVAHVLDLDSMKFDDSYLEKLNNNLNRIFKFCYQRWQELKQIAEMFEENF